MKRNLYKTLAIGFIAAFATVHVMGQDAPPPPAEPVAPAKVKAPAAPKKAVKPKAETVDCTWLSPSVQIKLNEIVTKVDNRVLASLNQLKRIDIDTKISKIKVDAPSFNIDINADKDYQAQYEEKTKVISKSYSVDRNDKLAINNQYGKVVVTTWNKNEIKVDVEVKAYDRSESAAEELLETVTISDSKLTNLISFKTGIKMGNSIHWYVSKRNGKEDRRGVEINYVVFMPSRNPLDITNKYGGTVIPDFDGPLNIISAYGSFTGKNLSNEANSIKVSYGSANIESLKSTSLEISYGSLKLANAEKLNAQISYSGAKIGKLSGDADINLKYSGGFKIDNVDNSVKNLNVNSAYSSVALGFAPASNFNFDVTVNYGSFKYGGDKFNVSETTPTDNARSFNPTKTYKGSYGKGSSARVIINSKYGSVKFD